MFLKYKREDRGSDAKAAIINEHSLGCRLRANRISWMQKIVFALTALICVALPSWADPGLDFEFSIEENLPIGNLHGEEIRVQVTVVEINEVFDFLLSDERVYSSGDGYFIDSKIEDVKALFVGKTLECGQTEWMSFKDAIPIPGGLNVPTRHELICRLILPGDNESQAQKINTQLLQLGLIDTGYCERQRHPELCKVRQMNPRFSEILER